MNDMNLWRLGAPQSGEFGKDGGMYPDSQRITPENGKSLYRCFQK